MILSEIIGKYYSLSVENIKNSQTNAEKREELTNLLGNLINAQIPFSIRQLSKILKVCRKLLKEVLSSLTTENMSKTETRGRKKVEQKHPEIIEQIKEICNNFEHIDKSLQDKIIYLDITLTGIKEKLIEIYSYSKEECPCENTIRRILIHELHYKITKVKKNKVYKKIPETNSIFSNVFNKLKVLENSNENIIGISIDDKVSKYIGCLSGGGKSWIPRNTGDHDTNPEYIVKPFGIMDLKTKETFVYCTTSQSTADFKVDCIEEYLIYKRKENPNINKMFIFLDNGPENSSKRKLWKLRIIQLAIKYQIEIELVYYPPYHSKYNKIEHFWGVLQRHWSGLIIDTLDKLIGAINSCTWDKIFSKGFLRNKEYENGRKVDERVLNDLEKMHIIYETKEIKRWSLLITP